MLVNSARMGASQGWGSMSKSPLRNSVPGITGQSGVGVISTNYGYTYEAEKPFLFTETGQILFLKIRDRVKYLLAEAGAFRMDQAIAEATGDSWQMLACVDRLVEIGEIHECTFPRQSQAAQNRIFTDGGWRP